MRLLFCLLLLTACGEPITAPKPATEGCTYVQVLTQNGYTVRLTHFLPPDHPLCSE
jgi:hypothetical protein